MERHRIYYREGSGASSQRLWAMWRLCLRLFLLSLSHHFHSICTNCPLFLVVQIDLILNSHLWFCPNPISKLKHALLPTTEVLQVKKYAPTLFFFHCFTLGPTFGSLEEFGGVPCTHFNQQHMYNPHYNIEKKMQTKQCTRVDNQRLNYFHFSKQI
jgi:hypothetical protein